MPAKPSPTSARATGPPRDRRLTHPLTRLVTAPWRPLVSSRWATACAATPARASSPGGSHTGGVACADSLSVPPRLGHTAHVVPPLARPARGETRRLRAQSPRGGHTGTVGATGPTRRPGRSRGLATSGAHQLRPRIRRYDRLERGPRHPLVTQRCGIVPGSRGVTAATLLRLAHDDLIDRFHRDAEARMARMIRSPPTTALTAWATWTLRLRRIARWRA